MLQHATTVLKHVLDREQKAGNLRNLAALERSGGGDGDQYDEMAKGVSTTTTFGNVTLESVNNAVVSLLGDTSYRQYHIPHKLFPMVRASQLVHEIPRQTARGNLGIDSAVPELGRPNRISPTYDRPTFNLKMRAYSSQVSIHLAQTSGVIGGNPAVEADLNARQSLLDETSLGMYFNDTRKERTGAGLTWKGIIQQIEEGTANSELLNSVEGPGHVVDLRGTDWNLNDMRVGSLQSLVSNLQANVLIGSPGAFIALENQIDPANRRALLPGQMSAQAVYWDSVLAGLNVGGELMRFIPDMTLHPRFAQVTYENLAANRDAGVTLPSTPSGTATAQTDNSTTDTTTSRFDANDGGAGSFFYRVTQVVGGLESAGLRLPTSGSITVAANQEVAFSISHHPQATCLRVYRSTSATSSAYKIFEVAADSSGTTTFFDNNLHRPNTEIAIAISMRGPVMSLWGNQDGWLSLQNNPSQYLTEITNSQASNAGIVFASLGAKYQKYVIGAQTMATDEQANFMIGCPIVVNPLTCVIYRNIKSPS